MYAQGQRDGGYAIKNKHGLNLKENVDFCETKSEECGVKLSPGKTSSI